MSAQVAADLRAAADVLERDGWVRDVYVDPSGACCAVGALAKVVDPGFSPDADLEDILAEDYERVAAAARKLIDKIDPANVRAVFWDAPITRWNDQPGRTAAEVIAALRAAADRAEAEQ